MWMSRFSGGRILHLGEMRQPESTAAHGKHTANISRKASLIFMLVCIVEPIARYPLGGG
jgi:hypothetical protein